MITGRRGAINVVLFVYCAGMLWVAYEIVADPDVSNRRLARLNFRYRTYQGIAEYFGRLGLDAEKAYLSSVEGMRTI